MDMEKNPVSFVDREENEHLSFGGSVTQKTTVSNNPPIKVTLFWPRYGSERVIGTGIMLGQVAGSRENHGCADSTVSKKLPAYVWRH
jgi:hypothetical protein